MRRWIVRLTLLLAWPMAALAAPPTPVVVELFTSEGCSSCPPADAVLQRLEAEQPLDGIEVIAVGAHVDYWDWIGWPDRFAIPAFTELQRDYAATRGDGRVHTPQVVVNGQAMAVGSRASVLRAMVRDAATQPPKRLVLAHADGQSDVLAVRLDIPATPPGAVLRVLLVERGLSTAVRRGENAGRTLAHAPTARAAVSQPVGGAGPVTVRVPLPDGAPAIDLQRSELVAMVQQPAGRVHAVGRIPAVRPAP